MKLLVIGGLGYIGCRLQDYISMHLNLFEQVVVVDSCEYTNETLLKNTRFEFIKCRYQNLEQMFFDKFDVIILLAAQGSVSNSKNLKSVVENSIINFTKLLGNLKTTQKLIYASSSSVYGKTNDTEVDEDYNVSDPYNFYDLGKQTIDKIAMLNNDKHFYGLRFGTVCGYSPNLRNDVMINSMVFNSKRNGQLFVSNKDINRPILGIDDLCRAILTIVFNGKRELSGMYNINSFNSTVDEIACTVAYKCGVDINYLDNSNKQNIVNFKLDTKCYDFKIHSRKFESVFNFQFTQTLDTIIQDLLDKWNDILNFENRLKDTFDDHKIINKCRICKTYTSPLLNLGDQPLANTYHYANEILQKYPLELQVCPNCFHIQINSVVKPEKLFENYLYLSGTSETLQTYFRDFAMYSLMRLGCITSDKNKKIIKILDIACNDASQLDAFLKVQEYYPDHCEFIRVGVDPAENIFNKISKHKPHDIYCEYFSQNTVNKLKTKYGHFDIIIAQNVFAHIDNPNEFLNFCKQLTLKDSLILIQTSQKNMIINGEFDTAYHEHLSFFNTNSMKYLCQTNNMILNRVDETPIHGTSYLFEVTSTQTIDNNVSEILYNEMINGLYSEETYKSYVYSCSKYKSDFHSKLLDYKIRNKKIIGFGSTAKSNVLLNYAKIGSDVFDYIIDENILKQGLLTPGSNIPIKDISSLVDIGNGDDFVIVVLAWNFSQEIIKKINTFLAENVPNGMVTLLEIHPLKEYNIYY